MNSLKTIKSEHLVSKKRTLSSIKKIRHFLQKRSIKRRDFEELVIVGSAQCLRSTRSWIDNFFIDITIQGSIKTSSNRSLHTNTTSIIFVIKMKKNQRNRSLNGVQFITREKLSIKGIPQERKKIKKKSCRIS